jgi:hypothetical protein
MADCPKKGISRGQERISKEENIEATAKFISTIVVVSYGKSRIVFSFPPTP